VPSNWTICVSQCGFTPSLITPATAYVVEDHFGPLGRAYRETDLSVADRTTILNFLYSGKYSDPVRLIAFNTSEGWSRHVSHEFATELKRRADLECEELIGTIAEFVEFYATRTAAITSLGLSCGSKNRAPHNQGGFAGPCLMDDPPGARSQPEHFTLRALLP